LNCNLWRLINPQYGIIISETLHYFHTAVLCYNVATCFLNSAIFLNPESDCISLHFSRIWKGYDLMGFELSKPRLRSELEADLKRWVRYTGYSSIFSKSWLLKNLFPAVLKCNDMLVILLADNNSNCAHLFTPCPPIWSSTLDYPQWWIFFYYCIILLHLMPTLWSNFAEFVKEQETKMVRTIYSTVHLITVTWSSFSSIFTTSKLESFLSTIWYLPVKVLRMWQVQLSSFSFSLSLLSTASLTCCIVIGCSTFI